jgi:hypothetical protein
LISSPGERLAIQGLDPILSTTILVPVTISGPSGTIASPRARFREDPGDGLFPLFVNALLSGDEYGSAMRGALSLEDL